MEMLSERSKAAPASGAASRQIQPSAETTTAAPSLKVIKGTCFQDATQILLMKKLI